MKRFFQIFAVLCMISDSVTLAKGGRSASARLDQYATDPLNASYLIEELIVRLIDGLCELFVAPGSATMIRTLVFGKPVYGDIDGDGDEDVVVRKISEGFCRDWQSFHTCNASIKAFLNRPLTPFISHPDLNNLADTSYAGF